VGSLFQQLNTYLTTEAIMAASGQFKLPLLYRAAFLLIEPVFALAGAIVAHFKPLDYLQLTHGASAPMTTASIPLSTNVVLTQLANLYLLFAFNEAFILRSTSDLRVWRTALLGMLIADFGHLYSVSALGPDIYWKVTQWNVMDFGSVGFVYAGACMRIAFLCGMGLSVPAGGQGKAKTSIGKMK
jgi:hypothetical protein